MFSFGHHKKTEDRIATILRSAGVISTLYELRNHIGRIIPQMVPILAVFFSQKCIFLSWNTFARNEN